MVRSAPAQTHRMRPPTSSQVKSRCQSNGRYVQAFVFCFLLRLHAARLLLVSVDHSRKRTRDVVPLLREIVDEATGEEKRRSYDSKPTQGSGPVLN
jgi:hypothetical protein